METESRLAPLPPPPLLATSRTTEESAAPVVARFVWRKTKLTPIVGLSFFSFPESASFVFFFFSFSSGQSLRLLHVPKENNVQRKRAKAFSEFVYAVFRFWARRFVRSSFLWAPRARHNWAGRIVVGASGEMRLGRSDRDRRGGVD